jgi:hypothetical protein
LFELPNRDYQQLAIIQVTADYDTDHLDVMRLAQRKACETGADALVILEDEKQGTGLYYILKLFSFEQIDAPVERALEFRNMERRIGLYARLLTKRRC